MLRLDVSNWEKLEQTRSSLSLQTKIDLMLSKFAAATTYPGELITADDQNDFALYEARTPREMQYVLEYLAGEGLISNDRYRFCVTPKGWQRLQPATRKGTPGTCFVAMSFDPTLLDAYNLGIRPAIEEDCGLRAIRIDRLEHNEQISDRILAEIQRCEMMVADFTGHRGGVYFEAGFALGLGRSVVWLCRADDMAQTHFDTRQYNHIVWTTLAELREKLANRIRATILR